MTIAPTVIAVLLLLSCGFLLMAVFIATSALRDATKSIEAVIDLIETTGDALEKVARARHGNGTGDAL